MQLLLVTLKVTKVNMHTFIEVIEPAKAHYCANSHQNPILTSRFLSYVQFSYQKTALKVNGQGQMLPESSHFWYS